jgi:glyceraldehyde-3-phosphate dehydrogenase/erythrose-4-phosphate dehydrogenase
MTIKVGINGFGRMVFRAAVQNFQDAIMVRVMGASR